MKNKFSVMLPLIFCALLAQAQDAPPDANWESDPLDVLEPQEPTETPLPTVPEFTEVPDSHSVESTPPTEIDAPMSTPVQMPPMNSPMNSSLTPDAPDSNKEARFHEIYKNFNEEPTAPETWERAMTGRPAEVYRVQNGDTLSGISGTLFGDQFFWPKVWSLNSSQILNPHQIEPGMGIQFFAGNLSEPPTLSLHSDSDALAKIPPTQPLPQGAMDGVSIPNPAPRPGLLEKLPPSLPGTRLNTVAKTTEVRLELNRHQYPVGLEHLGYYVLDSALTGSGSVTGAETGAGSVGEYQYIYVKIDGTPAPKYVVQKNLTEVEDPRNKERKAQMIQVQGQIEIAEKVNDAENIYRAMVTKSINPVEVGSLLVPGEMPMIDPTAGTPSSGVGATIMGGQFEKRRSLFGQNSLVFFDAGSSQGLQEGQTLPIFADARIRNVHTRAVKNDRVIGTVKIVRVTNNFATGYVVKATDDILVGDYAGRMTSAASLRPEISNQEPASDVAPEAGFEDSELEL